MDTLANKYASALFQIGREKNCYDSYREYFEVISPTLKEEPRFIKLLNSSFVSKKEKKDIIAKTFIDCPDKVITDFFSVLVDNSRVSNILPIINEYIKIANIYDQVSVGFVYSVMKLTKEQITKIQKAVETKIGNKVYLKNLIDESLIGGIKVVVDDYIFDSTIIKKIDNLKTALLEETTDENTRK